ncbi:MAG: SHOCT domain-containing protein [Actinomycetota bacterium]
MMIGGVFFVLLIAVGIGVAIWAAMQTGKSGGGGASADIPLDILKRRYANGEIDKKQYDETMKDLMK